MGRNVVSYVCPGVGALVIAVAISGAATHSEAGNQSPVRLLTTEAMDNTRGFGCCCDDTGSWSSCSVSLAAVTCKTNPLPAPAPRCLNPGVRCNAISGSAYHVACEWDIINPGCVIVKGGGYCVKKLTYYCTHQAAGPLLCHCPAVGGVLVTYGNGKRDICTGGK